MKILANSPFPFLLAHGGHAIQIQRTMECLREIGVEVEPLRWWDENQKGDIIHCFGRMPTDQIRFAHQKKIKVVMAELLTAQGSQNWGQRTARRAFRWTAENLAPKGFAAAFNWEPYHMADGFIAGTPWEKYLMEFKFGADPAKVHIVGNGVEDVFFQTPKVPRHGWLVCTATITPRKRVLELAEAAVIARTPVWIVGKPYSDEDSYAKKFLELASQHKDLIRFEGPVSDRAKLAQIYRSARGFVLLSTMESLSLSSQEAAASECPLLLSDLPWARAAFPQGATFCPVTDSASATAEALKKFYAAAPSLPPPPPPPTWRQIAVEFKAVYERVLAA